MTRKIQKTMKGRISELKNLQMVAGLKTKNPFGVDNLEDLNKKMSDMMELDLQKYAEISGVSSRGTRVQLKEKIRGAFLSHKRGSTSLDISLKRDPFTKKERANVAQLMLEE